LLTGEFEILESAPSTHSEIQMPYFIHVCPLRAISKHKLINFSVNSFSELFKGARAQAYPKKKKNNTVNVAGVWMNHNVSSAGK